MIFKRLSWRIGLPFAAIVLAGSVALVVGMGWHLSREDSAQFEKLARTNADFMNRVRLPASPRMAEELTQVLGVGVFFRHERSLTPEPRDPAMGSALLEIPADGSSHHSGKVEAVAVRLAAGDDLILTRMAFASVKRVWNSETFAVLGGFWLLAVLVAWMVGRGLVTPLRQLAARIPQIEKPGPWQLPAAARADEIGDLARAFQRTREALQEERSQREQAEKLAVLGRMTAALAHEIQNPVAAIKMHAQLWASDGASPARIIEDEASHIEEMVSQWMFLSKPEPPAMAELLVANLIQSSLASHPAQMAHAHIDATVDAPSDLAVRGDRRRLQQVFGNLIVNAIQAMPMGGRLHIQAKRAGDSVEITVTDSGQGFSMEAQQRFAEFFYSEKEGGMGIGLSVAEEISKAHGGSLRVQNRPEGGAAVTVTLPLAK